MHKTMLAAFVVSASAFAIPVFSQVNLGAAAQVGAGVNAGAAAPNTMHAAGQIGNPTNATLQHTNHKTKHAVHQTTDQARSTIDNSASAHASVNTTATANRAGNGFHSVGNAATRQSVGADANVNANADAHGH